MNILIPCYSYFNGKWHLYYSTALLTAVEMAREDTVKLVLSFGAKVKQLAATAAGGQLDAETLAEQRQDFSVMKVLKLHKNKCFSLKELCRFNIRHSVINEGQQYKKIDTLPLPLIMIEYLKFLR